MYAESVLDRTVANGDAECPTGAAVVVIDRPVSYDIYRNVKHVHVNPETSGRDNHLQYSALSSNI